MQEGRVKVHLGKAKMMQEGGGICCIYTDGSRFIFESAEEQEGLSIASSPNTPGVTVQGASDTGSLADAET